MIPLYDRNRSRTVPFVTIGLIVLNFLAFFYELKVGATGGEEALNQLIDRFGVRPACVFAYLTGKRALVVEREVPTFFGFVTTRRQRIPLSAELCLLPLLTSMFLHAGWAHLIGNMWFLWIFGDNVEDRLGHVRFLIFYLLGGILASLAHIFVTVAFSSNPLIPTIGASGAVSAVLGAYFIAFPHARIVTFLPIFFFFYLVEIPASIYLFIWFFVQQLIPGLGSLGTLSSGGVAFWAHIGGFVAGMGYQLVFERRRPQGPGRYVTFRYVGAL